MLLAKSNGTSLKDHSNAVALRCRELATEMLSGNELKHITSPQYTTEEVINACYVAGLLHDIGKAVPFFQEYIQGQVEPECLDSDLVDSVAEPDQVTRYHNEFSWAAVCTYEDELRKVLGINDRKCWEAVKYAIFWHHAAAKDYNEIKGRNIFYAYEQNKKFDMVPVLDCMNDLIGQQIQWKEPIEREIPAFFAINPTMHEDNALIMFVRAVLIRADREVSGYVKPEKESLLTIDHVDCPEGFDQNRYQTQMDIVNLANKVTNVVAAPAGFGKTVIGMVWALRFNETVYWVCPRNAVIDSVYRSLVDLKPVLGIDMTIEKLYTSIIQDSDKAINANQPHIVVTNIDAIVTPLASNKQANLQHDMMVKPMIFDEFHEFPMAECPMYAAFNLLMEVRNDFTQAPSLLVSATPYTLYRNNDFRNAINYLPEINGHYAPQHDVPYKVKIVRENRKPTPNTAQVFNVVKTAQEIAAIDPSAICFHSKFTTEDKNHIMDTIYSMYGKNANGEKRPVVSGPIMRASMDISFKNMELLVSSPNSDLQIIGRCNRWGEYDDATITFVVKLDAANRTYINHNDFPKSHLIYNAWVEFLTKNVKDTMTLSELYDMYDKFSKENAVLLTEYQKLLHEECIKKLVTECYPHRPAYYVNPQNRGNKGSLRNTDPSIYFIVKDVNGHYVGPFQIGESVTDFSNMAVAKDAFTPYYSKDRSELLRIIGSDPEFSKHFPELAKYLTEFGGKKGERRVLYYGNNPSMWRNRAFPFVVRPGHMTYDSVLGYRYCNE